MKNNQKIFFRLMTGIMILGLATSSTAAVDPAFVIKRIGSPGNANGELDFPMDIELIDDKYYVADFLNHRIQVFDKDWSYVDKFGGNGAGDGQFSGPAGLAFNGSHVYVADSGNDRVSIFDVDGNFIDHIGGVEGIALGEMNYPAGIDFYEGMIFVSESNNDRIQVFNESTLEPIKLLPGSNMGSPFHIQIVGNILYIANLSPDTILRYEIREGLNLDYLGSVGDSGDELGQLNTPYSILVVDDYLIIPERFDSQITILNMQGELVKEIQASFNGNSDVLIDGSSLYVSETSDNEITEMRIVATPHSVETIPGAAGISLTWDIDENAGVVDPKSYTIFRSSGNTSVELTTVTTTSYTDLATVPGEDYTYMVQANSILGSSELATSDSTGLVDGGLAEPANGTEAEEGSFLDQVPLSIVPFVGVLFLVPMLRRRSTT